MRIAVTGASGFIGKHVSLALSIIGHEVIELDLVGSPHVRADITKPLDRIPNLDAVIHLAAIAAPKDCDNDPARAFNVNVNGTHQVLKMAYESGAKKFVFSSSAHVYDIPPRYLPTDEVHPLRLNNTYTTTKVLGEQLCELYYTNHRLSYIALRLYNAYGADQARGYFIPDMIAKAQVGDISLGGGDTAKDFVHVDDVAQAFVKAVESPFVGAINIGTEMGTPLRDVASVIAEAFGRKFEDGSSPYIATRMQADIRRAKQVLGWEPTIRLEEGLRDAINTAKITTIRA
jgi:UDP-glucose 4-epimerase